MPSAPTRVLLIDNYDSFTYNLYQYLAELGAEVIVVRNDEKTIEECVALRPDRVLISPGPGFPKDAGISNDIIRAFASKDNIVPISGVCLGLQCMYEVFGGTVGHAGTIVHGKQSEISHDGKGLFQGLPSKGLQMVRYHSLVGLRETLPKELVVTATVMGQPDLIMGVRHKTLPIEAVQFHPESILSHHGKDMMRNFLAMK